MDMSSSSPRPGHSRSRSGRRALGAYSTVWVPDSPVVYLARAVSGRSRRRPLRRVDDRGGAGGRASARRHGHHSLRRQLLRSAPRRRRGDLPLQQPRRTWCGAAERWSRWATRGAGEPRMGVQRRPAAGQSAPTSPEVANDRIRRTLALLDLGPEIPRVNRWTIEGIVASNYRIGRVFMVGNADIAIRRRAAWG
jgi:hypothetical protein